jgi:hypothetical protein
LLRKPRRIESLAEKTSFLFGTFSLDEQRKSTFKKVEIFKIEFINTPYKKISKNKILPTAPN